MEASQIELRHSRWLKGLLTAMALLALGSIGRAALPVEVQALLALIALAGIGGSMWKMRGPLPGLRLKADGGIQVSVAGADWHSAEILPGSFVSPGFSTVRLRDADGAIHRFTLLPDSASPEDLRRLRVWLRWAPRTRSDTVSPGAG